MNQIIAAKLPNGRLFLLKRNFHFGHYAKQQAAMAARAQPLAQRAMPNVVLVDAVRTPFVQSNGVFRDMMAVDLQRAALLGILFNFYHSDE